MFLSNYQLNLYIILCIISMLSLLCIVSNGILKFCKKLFFAKGWKFLLSLVTFMAITGATVNASNKSHTVVTEIVGINIDSVVSTAHEVTINFTPDLEKITWSNPEYKIQRRIPGSIWTNIGTTETSPFVYTGFTVGTTYEYRVTCLKPSEE